MTASGRLVYDKPASRWTEALPLGNGSLGAMWHGGVGTDLWQLNHDTFWSGRPTTWDVPAGDAVAAARHALDAGDPLLAAEAVQAAQGPFVQSYQPLADLLVDVDHDAVTGYRRSLDLAGAVGRLDYLVDGTDFTRETWISRPDNAMFVRFRTGDRESFGLTVSLRADLPHVATDVGAGRLGLVVKAPDHVVPNYVFSDDPVVHDERLGRGMYAAVVVDIRTDGAITDVDGRLVVAGAHELSLVLSTATGFRGPFAEPDGTPDECLAEAIATLDALADADLDDVLRRHGDDHGGLYNRVQLELAADAATADLTTDDLLRVAPQDEQTSVVLTKLLFDYGRYLLIASSRPGTQPANLQGIWNRHVRPPWSCNYTLNINTQMNYWPAETVDLGETHLPLLAFVRDLSVTGGRTARESYGARGWLAHHNSDLWRHSMAVGDGVMPPMWVNWWMGGAWLAHHTFEHASFSGADDDYRRAYDVLTGVATFLLDWLTADDAGFLVTSPSTSPENTYLVDGTPCAVTVGSTMDLALAAQIFDDLLASASALDLHDPWLGDVVEARRRLRPPRIGAAGQLLEWDGEPDEAEPHHRHVSHLVGVFPGEVFRDRTDLLDAARVTLDRRGDASTGWSLAWKANLWARLGDGDRAWSLVRQFCTEVTTEEIVEDGGVYANLLCAHPPFQIDGNLGLTSAVVEMLVDGRGAELTLLPALPVAWPDGSITGLRARDGLHVELEWSHGQLQSATIRATHATTRDVLYADRRVSLSLAPGETVRLDADLTVGVAPLSH